MPTVIITKSHPLRGPPPSRSFRDTARRKHDLGNLELSIHLKKALLNKIVH